jgi:hypothetical protein
MCTVITTYTTETVLIGMDDHGPRYAHQSVSHRHCDTHGIKLEDWVADCPVGILERKVEELEKQVQWLAGNLNETNYHLMHGGFPPVETPIEVVNTPEPDPYQINLIKVIMDIDEQAKDQKALLDSFWPDSCPPPPVEQDGYEDAIGDFRGS